MPSKLKRRRWRRMRDDLAWYKDEAKDLHCRLMELADEVANLRKQILPESKTVIAKLKKCHVWSLYSNGRKMNSAVKPLASEY